MAEKGGIRKKKKNSLKEQNPRLLSLGMKKEGYKQRPKNTIFSNPPSVLPHLGGTSLASPSALEFRTLGFFSGMAAALRPTGPKIPNSFSGGVVRRRPRVVGRLSPPCSNFSHGYMKLCHMPFNMDSHAMIHSSHSPRPFNFHISLRARIPITHPPLSARNPAYLLHRPLHPKPILLLQTPINLPHQMIHPILRPPKSTQTIKQHAKMRQDNQRNRSSLLKGQDKLVTNTVEPCKYNLRTRLRGSNRWDRGSGGKGTSQDAESSEIELEIWVLGCGSEDHLAQSLEMFVIRGRLVDVSVLELEHGGQVAAAEGLATGCYDGFHSPEHHQPFC